jgi:hypothetical protein
MMAIARSPLFFQSLCPKQVICCDCRSHARICQTGSNRVSRRPKFWGSDRGSAQNNSEPEFHEYQHWQRCCREWIEFMHWQHLVRQHLELYQSL